MVLPTSAPHDRYVAYPVCDREGQEIAVQHFRYSESTKEVWWTRNGQLGLGGLRATTLPLYGIHELVAGIGVVLCEGPNARQALEQLGFQAVATTCGASSTPDRKVLADLCVASEVLLWPDYDEPGRNHMARIGAALEELGVSCRILEWDEASEPGDDAVDFLARGGTRDKLARLVAAARPLQIDREFEPSDDLLVDPDLVVTSQASIPEWSAVELLADADEAESVDQMPFLGRLDGPFVQGWAHIVAAPPKSGKTTLLDALIREWCEHGERVLLITEEPTSVVRVRLRRAGKPAPVGLQVAFALGRPQKDVIARAFSGQETIVIVDTWRAILGVGDENDAAQVAHAINPLVAAARKNGKTLILVHHTRKSGGEHGEAVSGSHASIGSVDVVIEVLRDKGHKMRRIVTTLSRVFSVPDLLYEMTDKGLRLLGESEAVGLIQTKARIRPVLSHDHQTTAEIRELLGDPRPTHDQVYNALREMAASEGVLRDPPLNAGKVSGKTLAWFLPPTNESTEPPPSKGAGSEEVTTRKGDEGNLLRVTFPRSEEVRAPR